MLPLLPGTMLLRQMADNAFEIGEKSINCLVAFLQPDRRSFIQEGLEAGGQLDPSLGYTRQRRARNAVRRGYRQVPSQQAIERGGQGIYIGPRPLPPISLILLKWCVPLLQNYRQVCALRSNSGAGGAEVEQLHPAITGQEDIIRTDVAVDQSGRMAGPQRVRYRNEKFQYYRYIKRAACGHMLI